LIRGGLQGGEIGLAVLPGAEPETEELVQPHVEAAEREPPTRPSLDHMGFTFRTRFRSS
jgi:hypothetical protein